MADGILNLDKPQGMTSARAVAAVKRRLPRGTKVGHAGTLDPFATGVLLVLVGRATKLCETVMGMPKAYEAVLKLGATTVTDDTEAEEEPTAGAEPVNVAQLTEAAAKFVGRIEQVPPVYSAMKIGGKRACDRVRAGQTVRLAARPVEVYAIEVMAYAWPTVRLRVECGRGMYIRSLARDIGQALGVGAYLTGLRRTGIGPFRAEEAVAAGSLDGIDIAGRLQELPAELKSR